jgi:hypothetical protein
MAEWRNSRTQERQNGRAAEWQNGRTADKYSSTYIMYSHVLFRAHKFRISHNFILFRK